MSIALRAYAESDDFKPGGIIGPRLIFEFSRELLPSYGWVFPTGDGIVNIGVGGPLRELQKRGHDLKKLLAAFIEQIRDRGIHVGELRDQRAHHLPLFGGMPTLAHPRAVLIGDAASMINPVSGEGIAYAVAAAARLVEALPDDLTSGEALAHGLAQFERDFRRTYRAHFLSSRVAHRLMRNPHWASMMVRAAQRDPQVLRDAIELLFGFGRIHSSTAARIVRSGVR
jgi:flavin-dependent dehydrogenase